MAQIDLTDNERDGIGELMNVGVGKAAAALGRLVKAEVELSVPRIFLVPLDEIEKHTPVTGIQPIAGSYSSFDGPLVGALGFVVPAASRRQFLVLVLGDEFDSDEAEVLEQDLLLEIGNIICNACIAGISNAFKIDLTTAPPTFFAASPREALAEMTGSRSNGQMLLVELDFALRSGELRVYLWMAMDEAATDRFRVHLGRYLAELGL